VRSYWFQLEWTYDSA